MNKGLEMQLIDAAIDQAYGAKRALHALDGLRIAVNERLPKGRKISRAELARRGQLNDATLARGLKPGVATRLDTAARAALGLLSAVLERGDFDVRAELYEIDRQVMKAAAALSRAVLLRDDNEKGGQAEFGRALGVLDQVLDCLPLKHHRLAGALRHLAYVHLETESQATRLALIGAALAVLERTQAVDPIDGEGADADAAA